MDMGIGDAGECRHAEFFDLLSPRQVNLTGKCGSKLVQVSVDEQNVSCVSSVQDRLAFWRAVNMPKGKPAMQRDTRRHKMERDCYFSCLHNR